MLLTKHGAWEDQDTSTCDDASHLLLSPPFPPWLPPSFKWLFSSPLAENKPSQNSGFKWYIICLLMNMEFGHGLVRIAFIPPGICSDGLKDSRGLMQWDSSDISSWSVNSEDLVILPHAFLWPFFPPCFQTVRVGRRVFLRTCHLQPSPGLHLACPLSLLN